MRDFFVFLHLIGSLIVIFENKHYACLVYENAGKFHSAQEFAWRVLRIRRGFVSDCREGSVPNAGKV